MRKEQTIMGTVYVLVTSWCPYCRRALSWMDELMKENTGYSKIEMKIIDEEKDPVAARKYDYYYVPTFYVDDEKIHEGVPTREIVRTVFEKALNKTE
ncbi:MAG: glutaredoxin [Firmicutes bacterium]|nr:glutaredoxin [Bacillota bacterium]